jgi:hypothetical protein
MATADGMRTIGASGGPFFPHATKATKDPHRNRREGHDEAFRTTKITKNQILLRDVRAFVVSDYYSAATASSEAIG